MHRIYIRLVMLAALLLPLVISAAEAPVVEEGKGLVVLYRMSKAKGAAIGFNLRSSSGFSGNLSNGSWLFEQVEPGQYT